MERHKQLVEKKIASLVDGLDAPKTLKESMAYSANAGGKRLRPLLLLAVLEALGAPVEQGVGTSAALEMIHTYSLVHDDLPAMDNDSLRRGVPTNHVVFGDGIAILAGDGLLTFAFSVVAEDRWLPAEVRLVLVSMLAKAAGPMGMIAGQILDMEAEKSPVGLLQLKNIHKNKTGRLIEFAVLAGALIGNANEQATQLLEGYASHLGLAFQIKDDILDVEGTAEELGKTPGKDATSQKSTYVSILGMSGAKEMLESELSSARQALTRMEGMDTDCLYGFIELVGGRNN
ncbi:MAG: polyprenyl synthetase family protein [Turicibacter sp.]|nr:polyprenyl synthetase family protein [Turicibacter sp.]